MPTATRAREENHMLMMTGQGGKVNAWAAPTTTPKVTYMCQIREEREKWKAMGSSEGTENPADGEEKDAPRDAPASALPGGPGRSERVLDGSRLLLAAAGLVLARVRGGVEAAVGDEVVEAVSAALPDKASLSEAGALLPDEQPGRHRLDIRTAARVQLQGAGINSERIAHCPLCTVSEPELFHSWRRDQVKAVQWSGIVAQAPT